MHRIFRKTVKPIGAMQVLQLDGGGTGIGAAPLQLFVWLKYYARFCSGQSVLSALSFVKSEDPA